MGLSRWSIRTRIFILVALPILTLIGLYAIAATITARNAFNVSMAQTLNQSIGPPTADLTAQVDAERRSAEQYLAAPVPANLAALSAQELQTERAQGDVQSAVSSANTRSNAGRPESQAITVMIRDFGNLSAFRLQVSSRTVTKAQVIDNYGKIIADADKVQTEAILQDPNVPLATQSLALVRAARSEEALFQEDALLTGDIAARAFPVADRQQFTELVGARRTIYGHVLQDLDPAYQAYYNADVSPQANSALAALENKVVTDVRPGPPPVTLGTWKAAVQTVSAGLSKAAAQTSAQLVARGRPIIAEAFVVLVLVAGIGLTAVILSIIASIWIARGLVRQLGDLRKSALQLANERLPDVVQRLRAGQDVQVSAEAPRLAESGDEIGQLTAAFNAVQETAIEAAVDEARLRRGVSDVFRNLARRSQSLLHRQLALLDSMERRATDPDELEALFRIDHLTTRMRRHSEGLIILSGESPGRGWRHPVRLVDVLRAAVSEVEEYTRIRVSLGTQAALIGPAVADVIHLIAELAENATIFSPPTAPVDIHGEHVGQGFVVQIEDRGLGMAEEKLDKINDDLRHPPQFDLSGSEQLGLFIAGQLARRHDIRITLRASAYGGITAIVLIPKTLIVDDAEAQELAAGDRPIRLAGRHAALNFGIAEPTAPAQLDESAADGELPLAPTAELPIAPADAPWDSPAEGPVVPVGQADSLFGARHRRSASNGSSFRYSGEVQLDDADGSEDSGPQHSASELTAMGLPVRVRQANLAPQLRDGLPPAAAGPVENEAVTRSPEAARSTMTALQRGWQRGRYVSGTTVPSFDLTQDQEHNGDGGEPRNDR
jgi:signal transduction histidine kinase